MVFVLFLNNSKEVAKISSHKFRDQTPSKLCMTSKVPSVRLWCGLRSSSIENVTLTTDRGRMA